MSFIDFIRSMGKSQDELDIGLEEFSTGSKQEAVGDDISGGRSWGRLLLVTLLFMGVTYVVSRLRSSSGDSSTDIALADDLAGGGSVVDEETGADGDATDDEDATVTIEYDPETETDNAAANDEAVGADETGDVSDEETDTDGDDAVEVEIGSPGDDEE